MNTAEGSGERKRGPLRHRQQQVLWDPWRWASGRNRFKGRRGRTKDAERQGAEFEDTMELGLKTDIIACSLREQA